MQHETTKVLDVNVIMVTESAQDREYASDVLEWNSVGCVLLEFRVIELVAGKDNQLRVCTLLDYPSRVCSMILNKLVQCKTFNVDCLR